MIPKMNILSTQKCKIHSFPFEVLYFKLGIEIHEEEVITTTWKRDISELTPFCEISCKTGTHPNSIDFCNNWGVSLFYLFYFFPMGMM
jgi:hypothetical protein